MVYIPGYGWYVILGLSLTPKQRKVFEVQYFNWWEKSEKIVLREESDIAIGLWIQTWSDLKNITITLHTLIL